MNIFTESNLVKASYLLPKKCVTLPINTVENNTVILPSNAVGVNDIHNTSVN